PENSQIRDHSVRRDQLADRNAALLQERHWPAGGVANRSVLAIDPEVLIERGEEVPDAHAPLRRVLTTSVGGANHLSLRDAAAAEQEGHGVRPVVCTTPSAPLATPPPVLDAYEIRGVRPKSPPTTRSTRLSRPRSCKSSTSAATAWSKKGARCFMASKTWWLTAWSSQLLTRPHNGPLSVTLTRSTPASTSRRPIRQRWPHPLRP